MRTGDIEIDATVVGEQLLVTAPAKSAEEIVIFDGRRDESMSDTRTLSGETARGEKTVAPCPLAAVQA